MKSLLDVAKTMDQQAAPSTRPAEAAASTLSLADFAKQQQQQPSGAGNESKPLSLMDVARQESARAKEPRAPTKSLLSLAQGINDEEHRRIEKALVATANEVKAEQRAHQASVLQEAVAEVRQEETEAALSLVAKIEGRASEPHASRNDKASNAVQRLGSEPSNQNHQHAAADNDDDQDGYSSFEGHEEEEEEEEEGLTTKKSDAKKKPKKQQLLDDDESESGGNNSGQPERTVASDSAESKAFLRAVYRADLRAIQDMLDSDDASATTADQHGWSGLHWAASQGHTKILELLLKRGAQINAVDHINGWAPLHVAAVREMLSCVKLLLQSGADPRIRDSYGDSAADLLRAVRGKKRDKFLQALAHFQASSA